jgi:threonine/homoserine/homoserine lactone efflux protein
MDTLGIQNIWLFVLAGWALNLTPGPDVFYMVSHALRSGVRAGATAAAGITAGCFVHVAAATLGLSALIAASSVAFTALKWVGATYLVYVGVQMLRAKAPSFAVQDAAQNVVHKTQVNTTQLIANNDHMAVTLASNFLKKVFLQGFWTNALNPKVALFFLAFLPQFIRPDVAHPSLAFLALGVLFNVNAIPINMGYVLLAAWVSKRVDVVQRSLHWLERVAGALFVGFGVKLAFSARD